MKHLGTVLLCVFLLSTVLLSQNYQVTQIQGSEILDAPVLDIQNGTAHITHNTNFWFYSFPSSGPAAPIPTSSAVHPRSIGYGPSYVNMKSNVTGIVISYDIYETSPVPGFYAESVVSMDGGTTWMSPHVFEKVADTLYQYSDNIVLEKGPAGMTTALMYYRVQKDSNRIHMVNNHGFGPSFSFIAGFPDTTASNLSCFAAPNGPNDNIFYAYTADSTLYLVHHNTPAPPGARSKILNIKANGSYFTRTRLVGNTSGTTLYLAFSFWEFLGGMDMMHMSNQGTVLYKSTNSGSTWSFADTISTSQYAIFDLKMTSTGTLVHVKAENSNVYVRSSLDGSHWSSFTQVNPTANTATGKTTFGMSAALIDDSNLGVAWIDTTTGYDEIFYRSIAIPTAPAAGVSGIKNSIPDQFGLNQNYPNPFNPVTTIGYQLAKNGMVSLKVFDLLGQEVATLVNEVKAAGSYEVPFTAANLPSGVYFYRLMSNGNSLVRKLTLVK